MPLSAWLLLTAEATDRRISKAERLREVFPAARLAERYKTQERVVKLIKEDGESVTSACRQVGISRATYDGWRLRDQVFMEMMGG